MLGALAEQGKTKNMGEKRVTDLSRGRRVTKFLGFVDLLEEGKLEK